MIDVVMIEVTFPCINSTFSIVLSENKSDIILIENIAFNYLLINYFSLDHQVSPPKPHSLVKLVALVIKVTIGITQTESWNKLIGYTLLLIAFTP